MNKSTEHIDEILNNAAKEWFQYTPEMKKQVFDEFYLCLHLFSLKEWGDVELDQLSNLLQQFRQRLLSQEHYEALAIVTEFCEYYEL